ncbi:protein PECTIC ARABINOGALACTAN SYNTHESIS-RELATED-like [Amaranthus tricolor]|uniref:protein PECTIC ARABINOGALACTAN SYNTHESIS-RELATED-like n=1 Tax=Amaranthus tricolor TaxID=29722 RepID=UPI00258C5DE1|nr:protein PECTIC ARABINOGALACTAN SYNTHESIS-RELATED-like [Amaranthus tricolor]
MTLVCGLIGLPPSNGVLPQSPMHSKSLATLKKQVMKEELANKEKLDGFKKHVTTLAALDLLVCLKSDLFVMTHGGNVFENTLC